MCWDTAYSTPDNTCTVVLGQSCGIATLVAAFDPDASVTLANLRYRLRSQRHRFGVRSAGHSLAPVLSVCPSSCLGGGPTACAVRSAPSELVVPQYLPSLVPPGVVDICDYELKLPVMHRLPDPPPSHNQCKRDYCAVAHWFLQERCESGRQGRAGVEWSQ